MHARANELLAAQGRPPIAHLTPHTLRRTFASILGVCRVDTRRAVALLGHTDPRMTLGVYAQLLKLGHGNVEALEQGMGCTRDEARASFESEEPERVQFRPSAQNGFRVSIRERRGKPRKAFLCRGFNQSSG